MKDPADCFCEMFDALDAAPFRDGRALDWDADVATRIAARATADSVLSGSFSCQEAQEEIVHAPDPERRRFEILCGLDLALAEAHPIWGTASSGVLADVAMRYLTEGRFNTDAASGALWPRFSRGPDEGLALESPQAAFTNVLRVPEAHLLDITRTVLGEPFGPGSAARGNLVFACSPMFESYEEVVFARPAIGYALGPNATKLEGRPKVVLEAMDECGAVVGCVPEGTLDAALLEEWRSAAGAERPEGSRLDFILTGTGAADGPLVGPRGANEAVVIERLEGTDVLRQRKRARFTLRPAYIAEWRLGSRLGAGPLTEDIVLGDKLALLECSVGRLAVAICEDVARLAQLGPAMMNAGVSLLLVPVFSKELREHYWEDSAAKAYANGIGADVVIVNSLAVANARSAATPVITGGPVDDADWHTAMLRGATFDPAKCNAAASVVVLRGGP